MKLIKIIILFFFILTTLFVTSCVHHGMSNHKMDHSKHRAMMEKKDYNTSIESYQLPDLVLTDNQGRQFALPSLQEIEKPVIVNFIYATCTTICPLLSMGYIDLQRELGEASDEVTMVSITIDPEHDTPEILEDYRKKFKGKQDWILLTGSRLDIDKTMTAFDSFFGDKMDHQPLNFIYLPKQQKWLRMNGMVNGKDFIHELKKAGLR